MWSGATHLTCISTPFFHCSSFCTSSSFSSSTCSYNTRRFISRLFGNTLWLIALGYYIYIIYLLTLAGDINLCKLLMDFYKFRVYCCSPNRTSLRCVIVEKLHTLGQAILCVLCAWNIEVLGPPTMLCPLCLFTNVAGDSASV
uniref:Uncharacterized protein n=1 Tax=Ixodes ricinus TaxID=34613 RepID=V5H6T4_IXORI